MNKGELLQWLADLEDNEIILTLSGGKINYTAPKDKISQKELEFLKKYKIDIISILKNEKNTELINDGTSIDGFPITDVQSAYILGRKSTFRYGGVGCHLYMELIYDELDIVKVNLIWNELIKKHDMLRVIFDDIGNQRVLREVEIYNIQYIKGSSEEEFYSVRKNLEHKKYNPAKWPLFDIAVINNKGKSTMCISFDMLIADWTSIWILIDQFNKAYYKKDLVIQSEIYKYIPFSSYVVKQKSNEKKIKYYRDKSYWMNRIKKLPMSPQLPIEATLESEGLFRRLTCKLSNEKWTNITEFAKKYDVTPNCVLIAAYSCILSKWSSNKKFCLSLTLMDRPSDEWKYTVGDFTSIEILEINVENLITFKDLAKSIQRRLFEDLEHKDFSGIKVLRELTRSMGREHALMPYVFTGALGGQQKEILNDNRFKLSSSGLSQTPQVFIDCQVMDDKNGLTLNWDIREGIFPKLMVEDLFKTFENYLNEISENTEQWEVPVEIKIPQRQKEIYYKANNTLKSMNFKKLHELVIEQSKKNPNKVAVIDYKSQLTYEELVQKSYLLANNLNRKGISSGDRIGIYMNKSSDQVVSALAVLLIGGIFVPIATNQPQNRIVDIVNEAKIKTVIVNNKEVFELLNIDVTLFNDYKIMYENISEIDDVYINLDDPAYIIFTSGSTGTPKGVTISHKGAVNTIIDVNERFGITSDDNILGVSDFNFDLSIYDIFGILSSGGCLIYPDYDKLRQPSHWLELIIKYDITIWNSVPALMQMFVAYLETVVMKSPLKLKSILLSGDWIPKNLVEQIKKVTMSQVRVYSLGGATEASIWSIFHECADGDNKLDSIPYGYPLCNQKFRILDKHLKECPLWVKGDLYIEGIGLALGYFNNEEATKSSFITHSVTKERVYRTGDCGRYMENGEIEFWGREDQQIKLNGYRIELGEIENAIKGIIYVNNVGVVHDRNSIICGVEINKNKLIYSNNKSLDGDIKNKLREKLPDYMIPDSILIYEVLPLTDNEKVNRNTIKIDYLNTLKKERNDIRKDIDKFELFIKNIWESALGLKNLDINKSLYKYGADSLIMAQVASKISTDSFICLKLKIKEKITFDVILRQMLTKPTIADIASFIREVSDLKENGLNSNSKEKNLIEVHKIDLESCRSTIMIHGGLGTLNCYNELEKNIVKTHTSNILGFSIVDGIAFSELETENLIENISGKYLDIIVKENLDNNSSINIIGYSIGGAIALEISRRLMEIGINLNKLVLIDVHPMIYGIKEKLLIEMMFLPNFGVYVTELDSCNFDNKSMNEYLFVEYTKNNNSIPEGFFNLTEGNVVSDFFINLNQYTKEERFEIYSQLISSKKKENVSSSFLKSMYQVYEKCFFASNYQPEVYFGDTVFLLANEQTSFIPVMDNNTNKYWENICLGNLKKYTINGNHINCVKDKENIDLITNLIAQY